MLTSEDERESVLSVSGPSVIERRAVVAAACAALDRRMLMLSAADVPQAPAERDSLVRLIERELVLTRGVLVLEIDESGSGADHAARRLAERFRGTLIVSSAMRPRELPRTVTAVDLRRPHALPERLVWPRAGLDEVAERIEPVATWDDLVLPEAQTRDARARSPRTCGSRATVYDDWGFAAEEPRGTRHQRRCSPAPSGTGKTMAAEVLAHELRAGPLSRSTSARWSASTSARPRRTCAACSTPPRTAARSCCSTRPTRCSASAARCKDSHDRYANIEVSYLLQRMEAYRGPRDPDDEHEERAGPGVPAPAPVRRPRSRSPMPPQRAEIWRAHVPAPRRRPTGSSPTQLARLNVAGGNIRNIALNAAFLAADAGGPVRHGAPLRGRADASTPSSKDL